MKTVMLFFLICAVSINSYAQFSNGEISLEYTKDWTAIGDENVPIKRDVFRPVCAYLYNKVVTIDFWMELSSVTVSVINETTGKMTYSELVFNPTSLSIDLTEKGIGNYVLEIVSDNILCRGYFSL